MSKSESIVYEPHPVTPERKVELRAQGLRIIDAQFKPADVESTDESAAPEAPAAPARTSRGRK